MLNKIRNLIRSAVNLGTDDSGKFRRGLSKYLGQRKQTVESLVPFGTFGKPPAGNQQIVLAKQGHESNAAVIELDAENRIIKDTEEGEYGTGNPVQGSYTYYKDNGDVEIKTGDTTLILHSNGTIEITGTESIDLITVIDDWMTVMQNALIITGIGFQPFAPSTLANMALVQVDLQKLKV